MPVLARRIEAAGIPTVTVTMMPATAEQLLTPRIVGVEFPFGHAFGMPHDRAMQRRVLELALDVLAGASANRGTNSAHTASRSSSKGCASAYIGTKLRGRNR